MSGKKSAKPAKRPSLPRTLYLARRLAFPKIQIISANIVRETDQTVVLEHTDGSFATLKSWKIRADLRAERGTRRSHCGGSMPWRKTKREAVMDILCLAERAVKQAQGGMDYHARQYEIERKMFRKAKKDYLAMQEKMKTGQFNVKKPE